MYTGDKYICNHLLEMLMYTLISIQTTNMRVIMQTLINH